MVLTADRTLMSDYAGGLFLGFLTTAPRRGFPLLSPLVIFSLLAKPVPVDEHGRALLAPHGLRRVEAALLASGVVAEDELAVVTPHTLSSAIGPDTQVIGVSTNDPLGLGPSSTTMAGPYGAVHEEPMTAWKFRELVRSKVIQGARRRGAKLVVGGPGSWQLDEEAMRRLGIDVVVQGEAELMAPRLFKDLMDGRLEGPAVVEVPPPMQPEAEEIPRLRGGTIGGLVEVSRGCGKGCAFCLPTLRKLRHRPIPDVLADVEVNVRAGKRGVCLHAEDVLRYGSQGLRVRPEKVVELFRSVASARGVVDVGISHASLSSIASEPKLVEEVSSILGLTPRRWMGFQTGIETGSVRLMESLMRFKPHPFRPREWPDVVEEAFALCAYHGWVPCATLIVNLPGEREEDVEATLELVRRLEPYKSLMVPLLYVPPPGSKHRAMRLIEDASPLHLELYRAVLLHDLKWIVELADDYAERIKPPAGAVVKGLARLVSSFIRYRAAKFLSESIFIRAGRQAAQLGPQLRRA